MSIAWSQVAVISPPEPGWNDRRCYIVLHSGRKILVERLSLPSLRDHFGQLLPHSDTRIAIDHFLEWQQLRRKHLTCTLDGRQVLGVPWTGSGTNEHGILIGTVEVHITRRHIEERPCRVRIGIIEIELWPLAKSKLARCYVQVRGSYV